jgi:RNA polymerase sigma-70 factor (ECF subfamily)
VVTTAATGDAALWQAAATGDHDAFGLLFDRHAKAVYNFLLRRTTDWSLAEDLTGAVFLQAWRRHNEVVFDGDSALPWLLGVARLVLRNASRSRTRYQSALGRVRANPLAAGSGPADPADVVVTRLDSERQLSELRAAIARLPARHREVIELCVYAGLDQQAAAVALGISVGTVKSRLHRARQQLASDLGAPQPSTTAHGMEAL